MGREGCGDRRSSTSQDQPQYSRKYVPSEDIGDYEVLKKEKSSRKTSGPLYPLTEEGDYGAPPAPIPRQRVSQQYEKRERKLKVYASYAVDSDCCAHSKVLTRNESDRGRSPPKPIRRRNTTENRPPPQRLERKGSARLSQSSRRSSKAKRPPTIFRVKGLVTGRILSDPPLSKNRPVPRGNQLEGRASPPEETNLKSLYLQHHHQL